MSARYTYIYYAVRYFDKYNKQKRTFEATSRQLEQTEAEIEHLESISTFLDIARKEEDLAQIKEELTEYGYIKRHFSRREKAKKSGQPSLPLSVLRRLPYLRREKQLSE